MPEQNGRYGRLRDTVQLQQKDLARALRQMGLPKGTATESGPHESDAREQPEADPEELPLAGDDFLVEEFRKRVAQ